MKIAFLIYLLFFHTQLLQSQEDSIRRIVHLQALYHEADSIFNQLEKSKKTFILSFCSFGIGEHDGVVVWKDGKQNCAIKLRRVGSKITRSKIPSRKLDYVFSSGLYSDACNFCKLLAGDKKSSIDHDIIMYFRRQTSISCQETYYTYSAYQLVEDNCMKGLKYLMSL